MKKATITTLFLFFICNISLAQNADSKITELIEKAHRYVLKNETEILTIGDNAVKNYNDCYIQAFDIAEQQIARITDFEAKSDYKYLQIRLLSELIPASMKDGGLSVSEYKNRMNKKASILQSLIADTKNSSLHRLQKSSGLLWLYDVLGMHYIEQGEFANAKQSFVECVQVYNSTLTNSKSELSEYFDANELNEIVQEAYYYMGMAEWKLGNKSSAETYYNKAKSIIGGTSLPEYK